MLKHRIWVGLSAGFLAATLALTRHSPSSDVVAHEWGTFTSVAGADGRAIEWLPLGGPTDLPCFVGRIRGLNIIGKGLVPSSQSLTYELARTALWGKVRMETPVIYFYSNNEYNASVTVDFPRGVITEFYPSPVNAVTPFSNATLRDSTHVHSMQWYVTVSPNIAPMYKNGGGESHYYAARATDATPLRVGPETEKFVFYRGVGSFDVPLQTKLLPNGDVEIWNLLREGSLSSVILFENRNGRVGYRIAGDVNRADTLAPPALTGDVASLKEELRKELVRAGLYPKEAQAMLDTWRDSWFEEGSRVFYILPRKAVDAILPLRIQPDPTSTARVFVGRMELIDNATMKTVRTALDANDRATLDRYGRFLSPIAERIIAGGTDQPTSERLLKTANQAFLNYTGKLSACY